ncbi:MAG: carbohydrate kinase family protein, partial [Pseudomonadota bacterium]
MPFETKPAVLSVGRLYCDMIFTGLPRLPSLGTEVFTEGFGTHAGGGAFITAAHMAALGHATSLATMLPSTPFSDLMRPELEASKVDLSLSGTLPEADGPQVTVAMVQSGDRAFLTRKAGPAFPALLAGDLARRGVKHLHIGELASLVAQPQIIDVARAQGMTISVDCSWDDALDAAALRPLAGKVDVFLPNEAEWAMMQEMGLAETFAPLSVIKQGAAG